MIELNAGIDSMLKDCYDQGDKHISFPGIFSILAPSQKYLQLSV